MWIIHLLFNYFLFALGKPIEDSFEFRGKCFLSGNDDFIYESILRHTNL